MDILLATIDPVAFSIGPLEIRWYGLIIAMGIVIAYAVGQHEMVKRGFHIDFLTDLLIWTIPLSIVGARLYYVAFEWTLYKDHPFQIFQIWNGGIAIHGALLTAVVVVYIFTKKHQTSFFKIADILAPSILIGQAIGRWGNFMNQEAHGGEVSRAFLENLLLPDWIIDQMYIEGAYYHPTFLYESLWSCAGVLLLLLLRRMNLVRGELFFIYIIWYSIGRFFIEGMRTDSLYVIGELRTAQLVSVVAILVALCLMTYRHLMVQNAVHYQDE